MSVQVFIYTLLALFLMCMLSVTLLGTEKFRPLGYYLMGATTVSFVLLILVTAFSNFIH